MRINPVNYNIVQIAPKQKVNQTFKNNVNAKTGNFVQQNAPSFTGYGSGKYKITDLDLVQISDLIRKTDSQRLDESGKTVQGVYPYAGKYMVKSPDALIHDTALKEYSILNKIRDLKGGETICPKPFEIAQSANRPFLVEEFIPGKHAGELPITLKDVKGLAEKFIILQTQYLNTYDQPFHTHDDQIADNHHGQVGIAPVFRSRQHHDHLHHGRMAHRESADTHEGKRVGKIA